MLCRQSLPLLPLTPFISLLPFIHSLLVAIYLFILPLIHSLSYFSFIHSLSHSLSYLSFIHSLPLSLSPTSHLFTPSLSHSLLPLIYSLPLSLYFTFITIDCLSQTSHYTVASPSETKLLQFALPSVSLFGSIIFKGDT
jgi:hypothetical protein